MRKNIDLSDEAVKALSIQAIENGTNFKNYVEAKLEELAKTKLPPKGAKEGGEGRKNKKLLTQIFIRSSSPACR